ncbi:MAG: hypothetical protein ABEI99_11260 [Halobaculum sp.]
MSRNWTRRDVLRRTGAATTVVAGTAGPATASDCGTYFVEVYGGASDESTTEQYEFEFQVCTSGWTATVTDGGEGDEEVFKDFDSYAGAGDVGTDDYDKWRLEGVSDVVVDDSATDDSVDVFIYAST